MYTAKSVNQTVTSSILDCRLVCENKSKYIKDLHILQFYKMHSELFHEKNKVYENESHTPVVKVNDILSAVFN